MSNQVILLLYQITILPRSLQWLPVVCLKSSSSFWPFEFAKVGPTFHHYFLCSWNRFYPFILAIKSSSVMRSAHAMFIISSRRLLLLSLFHLSDTILITVSQLFQVLTTFSFFKKTELALPVSFSLACFSWGPLSSVLDFSLVVYSFLDFFLTI